MMFYPIPPLARQYILVSLFSACDFLAKYGKFSQPDLELIPLIFQFPMPYSHVHMSWNALLPFFK